MILRIAYGLSTECWWLVLQVSSQNRFLAENPKLTRLHVRWWWKTTSHPQTWYCKEMKNYKEAKYSLFGFLSLWFEHTVQKTFGIPSFISLRAIGSQLGYFNLSLNRTNRKSLSYSIIQDDVGIPFTRLGPHAIRTLAGLLTWYVWLPDSKLKASSLVTQLHDQRAHKAMRQWNDIFKKWIHTKTFLSMDLDLALISST